MDELNQLKSLWFDIEMQMRALVQQRGQVEARLQQLMNEPKGE